MPDYSMEGVVDNFQRPILDLRMAGFSSVLPCFIDTGFNRSLMMPLWVATEHGFRHYRTQIVDWLTLADGSRFGADRMHGSIIWFGESRTIDVQIVADSHFDRAYQ